MVTEKAGVNGAPGVSAAEKKVTDLTVKDVEDFLKKDLIACINMLDSIYKDPATLESLATFLHGRMLNHFHREELKKQGKLDL